MMNFTIEGNMHEKLERFGEAAGEVGERLVEVVFDVAKEWMDEVKEELADKFAEEMMETFEEIEKQEKEHEEMGKEQILPGAIGEHAGHSGEGGAEGKSEGMGKEEKTSLEEAGSFGAKFANAITFSNVIPNAAALFRLEEHESGKSVSLLYDPGYDLLSMLPGLFSQNRAGQKQLFDSVMMAKRSNPLVSIANDVASEAGGEAGGEGGGEGGEGGGEAGGESGGGEGETATIMRNDVIFINRALHKATYEVISEKEQGLESKINKAGRRALRDLLSEHGF